MAVATRLQIPDRSFDAAARHVVAANMPGQGINVPCVRDLTPNQPWRNVIARDQPRGRRPFFVVKRVLTGRDLAPTRQAFAHYFDHDNVALVRAAETGLEEMDQ